LLYKYLSYPNSWYKCIKIEYSYLEIRIDMKCKGCCLFLPFQFLDQNAKKVERKSDQHYREKNIARKQME
jgi:hypothetical protein